MRRALPPQYRLLPPPSPYAPLHAQLGTGENEQNEEKTARRYSRGVKGIAFNLEL